MVITRDLKLQNIKWQEYAKEKCLFCPMWFKGLLPTFYLSVIITSGICVGCAVKIRLRLRLRLRLTLRLRLRLSVGSTPTSKDPHCLQTMADMFILVCLVKLGGKGPVDNRHSTEKLHHFVHKKKQKYMGGGEGAGGLTNERP